MSRNEFEKQMLLSYNSIQCGRTTEYLLGPYSASSIVMLSLCCYMDLRRKEMKTATSKLQTFVNRCVRKILKTHWPEVIANEEPWRTEEIQMSMQIKRRQWKWIRHTMRKGNEAIERDALDWNPQGKRRRGGSRHTWRRAVHNEALEKGKSWNEAKRMGGNRTRWRCFVEDLCPLREDRNCCC